MPLQIKRHLIILVILVGAFIVFRHLLIPDSFGELGFYRANSLHDNEHIEINYAGSESCAECHQDQVDLIEMDLHYDLSCESCHGPGIEHNLQPDSVKMILPESRDFCALCHSLNPARDRDMVFQINLEDHNADKECNYCHNPHAPWELRNQETPEENL